MTMNDKTLIANGCINRQLEDVCSYELMTKLSPVCFHIAIKKERCRPQCKP